MTLKEFLDALAAVSGYPRSRLRVPHAVAFLAGISENILSRVAGREPRIPLEGVRMARHKMFVDCSLAVRELGFQSGSVDAALDRATRWYIANGHVKASPHSAAFLRKQMQ
jgi:dihydroflavonol-4-reductase